MRPAVIAILAFLPNISAAQQRPKTTPPPNFDAYVEQVRRTFEVPGMAVAIVKDGRVVLAKGYGVKKLGESAPVTPRTRFGIASNTKAFTATALGMLVEEGKIEWDAPVVRYLPEFAMYDPWVTREITVRDLLVHRSGLGLGAGDLMWWPASTLDRREIARRIRFIRPATSFRTAYAYDNVLYSVAGELIERVSGQTWEDFVAKRILQRVGMTQSNVRHSDMSGADVATTHARVDGVVQVVTPFLADNTNPAGGINSTAEDMAKWMIVQLDSGRLADGSRIFGARTTRQLWEMVMPIPPGPPPASMPWLRRSFNGYALGFAVRDYSGYKLLSHTGGLPGYVSLVMMVPDLRLGVAVLTNQESGGAFNSVGLRVVDHYMGSPQRDYPALYRALEDAAEREAREVEARARTVRDSASGPSLALAKYAGTYTDPWYGDVTISLEGGKLVMRFSHTPSLVGDLVHWQHDAFVVRWRQRDLRADAYVTFALTPGGEVERARMQAVSPRTDFSFDFQDLDLVPVPRR